MATLESVDGRSLVPNLSGPLNTLFSGIEQRRQQDAQLAQQQAVASELENIFVDPASGQAAGGPQRQSKALARLMQLDPEAGRGVLDIIKRGDVQELEQANAIAQEKGRRALLVSRQPDHASKIEVIRQIAEQDFANGESVDEHLKLMNLSPEELDVKIQRDLVGATDVKKLSADALAKKKAEFAETREVKIGDRIVTQEIDPNTGEIRQVGDAPRFNPRAGVTVNVGGKPLPFKLPPGFMLKNPDNPAEGVTPIPGSAKDAQTPEAAAKTQMIQSAISSLESFKEMIAPGGEIDRGLIATMSANIPFSKGREAKVLISDAIEAKLRAESGAAVPDSEVVRAAARFLPSPFDNDATIQRKGELLDAFMQGSFDKIDPSGRFSVEETIEQVPEVEDVPVIRIRFDANGNQVE